MLVVVRDKHNERETMTRKEWVTLNRKVQEAVDGLDGACRDCGKQYHEMTKQEAKQHLEGTSK